MKYIIIKSFKGSPDGRYAVEYQAGPAEVELTDSLAKVALEEGWAKPAGQSPDEKKKTKGGGKASAPSSDSDE